MCYQGFGLLVYFIFVLVWNFLSICRMPPYWSDNARSDLQVLYQRRWFALLFLWSPSRCVLSPLLNQADDWLKITVTGMRESHGHTCSLWRRNIWSRGLLSKCDPLLLISKRKRKTEKISLSWTWRLYLGHTICLLWTWWKLELWCVSLHYAPESLNPVYWTAWNFSSDPYISTLLL